MILSARGTCDTSRRSINFLSRRHQAGGMCTERRQCGPLDSNNPLTDHSRAEQLPGAYCILHHCHACVRLLIDGHDNKPLRIESNCTLLPWPYPLAKARREASSIVASWRRFQPLRKIVSPVTLAIGIGERAFCFVSFCRYL